jgi:hypothetical protein
MMDSFEGKPRFARNRYRFIFFPLMAAAAVLFFGGLVMYLWNAILPAVTSAREISFWQAVGLLVLSRILFGGFRGGPFQGGPRHRARKEMREKWMNMTDDEKSQLRDAWRRRCEK